MFDSDTILKQKKISSHDQSSVESVFFDLREFLKRQLSVEIGISQGDGSIDKLLQLNLCEVIPDHDLKYMKQVAVRDEPIIVHIVDPKHDFASDLKSNFQFYRISYSNKVIQFLNSSKIIKLKFYIARLPEKNN